MQNKVNRRIKDMIFFTRFKKVLLIILFIVFLYPSVCMSESNKKIIKIAIIDNFHFQPNITNNYEKFYLSGIKTAVYTAKEKGFKIEYKLFRYSREPLAILKTIPKVNLWQPDVIIGPRNSNMFITLRNSFRDILVLSPYASSSELESMPSNYYSLSLSDEYMAQAIYLFLNKHFPKKRIFAIVEANCKNCIDISHEVNLLSNKHKPEKQYIEKLFLQSSVKTLNIEKILDGYMPNDVIFMPNTSYASAILMVRITNHLNRPMLFVGADDWGGFQNSVIGKLKANSPYTAIRVSSWSLDSNYMLTNEFIKKYKEIHNQKPDDAECLLAYATVSSIISALTQFPELHVKNMRSNILSSYMQALKNNKNWYKDTEYTFYKNIDNKDVLLDTIKLPL